MASQTQGCLRTARGQRTTETLHRQAVFGRRNGGFGAQAVDKRDGRIEATPQRSAIGYRQAALSSCARRGA